MEGLDRFEVDTNFGNHSIRGWQSVSAVVFTDGNLLGFVVVDECAEVYGAGASLTRLAAFLAGPGVKGACDMDGAGSSRCTSPVRWSTTLWAGHGARRLGYLLRGGVRGGHKRSCSPLTSPAGRCLSFRRRCATISPGCQYCLSTTATARSATYCLPPRPSAVTVP